MRKLLVIFAILTFTVFTVYAYDTVPYRFDNIVPYGISPDEVNKLLVESNFISQAIEPVSGTFYQSRYPDPDIAWYNPSTMRWMNITFTTNNVDQLFMRDVNIYYFAYISPNEFKCMTVRGAELTQSAAMAGQDTKWVYRFFFHNDRLFAVTSRYEADYTLEQYKARNPNDKYANPGFVMSGGLFQRIMEGFQYKYGGFQNSRVVTLDQYTTMMYGNYASVEANLTLSLYYATYMGKHVNFTVSYVDNFRMEPIAMRFQNKVYENYFDMTDIPVGIYYKSSNNTNNVNNNGTNN